MAQSLLDAFVGVSNIENGTYLTVQSILDNQSIQETSAVQPSQLQSEDDDVFQCGKCKRQFGLLQSFVSHKQTCTGIAQVAIQSQQAGHGQHGLEQTQSHQLHQTQQQHLQVQQVLTQRQSDSVSPNLNQLATNIVIPDDMMALALDSNSSTALHVQNNNIQNNPFLSSTQVSDCAINIAQDGGVFTSYASSTASLTPFTSSLAGQFQIHPVTVMPSNSAVSVVTSQHQGNPPVSGNGMIAVLVENSDQAYQHTAAPVYTTSAQPQVTLPEDTLQDQEQHEQLTKITASNSQKKSKRHGSSQQHSCEWCKKKFAKSFDLKQHVRAHTGEKPFQCVVCGRAFSQKSNVKKHMQTHKVWPVASNRTLPEQVPSQVIVVQSQIDYPSTSKQADPVSPDQDDEDQEKSSPQTLGYLIDSSYVCPYCPNTVRFDTFHKLRSHLVVHKSEQVYKCIMKGCQETFEELDQFLEHTKTHESRAEMSYRCHVCNKEFPTLDDLGSHQYSHCFSDSNNAGDSKRQKSGCKYKCVKCGSVYSTPEALRHHETTSDHSHKCPYCSKVYPCERFLRRHLQSHNVAGDVICDICGKHLKSEYYLKVHRIIHTGEKPFSCPTCGLRFNRKDKVKRHMYTHDTVKKFICPFKDITGCDKAYNRPDKLKEHISKHRERNTLVKANDSSVTPAGRVLVIQQPTSETGDMDKMLCKHCLSCRFDTEKSLEIHERLCSQVPRMTCQKCKLTFNTRSELDTHNCNPKAEQMFTYAGTIKFPIDNRRSRGRKRGTGRISRIELSPPPVRRTRGTRSRPRARETSVTQVNQVSEERMTDGDENGIAEVQDPSNE